MIRTVIIDDEINARLTICGIVEAMADDFRVVAEAEDVSGGIETIKNHKPDLVLLDIDMPDGNAFNLLDEIGNIDFKIIFITAFDEYAIKAFKFSAIDYILKPIISSELLRALNKTKKAFEMEEMNLKLNTLLSNLKASEDSKKLVLKSHDSILSVDVNDIYFCESDGGSYTRFYFSGNKQFLVSKPLKEYDRLLSGFGFFRIHKSYLVNMKKITKYDKLSGGSVILENQKALPVSFRKRDQFIKEYLAL